jgi:hypothetical protein
LDGVLAPLSRLLDGADGCLLGVLCPDPGGRLVGVGLLEPPGEGFCLAPFGFWGPSGGLLEGVLPDGAAATGPDGVFEPGIVLRFLA